MAAINIGMICSICAGILIGLKLYYDLQILRRKDEEEAEKEANEYVRRQTKKIKQTVEAEKRKNEELEKLKELKRRLQYEAPFEDKREKVHRLARELWYGSSFKPSKELEGLLHDPNTLYCVDSFDPLDRSLKLYNKGIEYIITPEGQLQPIRPKPSLHYTGEYCEKLKYREGDLATFGDTEKVYHQGEWMEIGKTERI